MIKSELYPALNYYFNAYLNQDFDLIFGDADQALFAYKTTENSAEQSILRHEIKTIIDSSYSDSQLQALIFDTMDCNYYYLNDWHTAREWLCHLVTILDKK